MASKKHKKASGEFYADYDPGSGSYCVFNSEGNKAYESYSSQREAEDAAVSRNKRSGQSLKSMRNAAIGAAKLRRLKSKRKSYVKKV